MGGMEFSLYGREGGALVEGMVQFKYLGLPLDKTDDYWPAVRQNVKRARRVWGRLGKMLQREGAEIKVSEILYRAVLQALLLFGSESWVMLKTAEKTVEGAHTGFMHQIAEIRRVK